MSDYITYNGKDLKIHTLKDCGTEVVKDTCPRCGGSGKFSFNMMYGTMCFKCEGRGYVLTEARIIRNRIKREAALEKQRAKNGGLTNAEVKRANKAEARLEAQREVNNGLTDSDVYEMIEFCREQARLNKAGVSQFIGNIGDKVEVSGTVIYFKWCATQYGASALVIIKDEDGNKIKMFNSGKAGEEIFSHWEVYLSQKQTSDNPVLPQIVLKGTVKKHETYRDEKSTMLTRAKVVVIARPFGTDF